MEKRNTIILTLISIATLLVAVVGATYAYFASSITTTNKVSANVNTSSGAGTLSSFNNGSISISITAEQMLESNQNDNTAITPNTGDRDNATITVNLTAPIGQTITCTYDLVWEWDTGTNTYSGYGTAGADLTGANYEYTRVNGTKITGNELTLTVFDGQSVGGTVVYAEKNMDPATMPVTNRKAVLKPGVSISATGGASAVNTTSHNYTAQMKFYNRTVNQSIQQNKSFSGNVHVENVKC